MIENFTKEELDALIKEMKSMKKNVQKRNLCEKNLARLNEIFKAREEYKHLYTVDLEDAIFTVADFILCNFEMNPKKKAIFRRSVTVNKYILEEYKTVVDQLIDVVASHFKERIVEE